MKKTTIYDYARMCTKHKDCRNCPLSVDVNRMNIACLDLVRDYPNKANEIILKWCEEHPVETRQDRFLKMFPNAKVRKDGVLGIDPCNIDKDKYVDADMCSCPTAYGFTNCGECRKEYWLAEVEE